MMMPSLMRYLADLAEVQDKHFDALDADGITMLPLKVESEYATFELYEEGWQETEKPV